MSKEEDQTEPVAELSIDQILDNENCHNKTEAWNKLNKTSKMQKLHAYSDKFGVANKYSTSDISHLKRFFTDALEKKKLQKTKEVMYDKITQEVKDVPGLFLNPSNRSFTIRIDTKRISTLKSLTPKRLAGKLKPVVMDINSKDEKDE
jgi:hypothetical protein